MREVKLIFLLSIAYLVFFLIPSCRSDSDKNKKEDKGVLYENFIEVDNSGVNYKIPSPMEMFIFLRNNDSPFLDEKIHKSENAEKYMSIKLKAINFGIYTADLAYCSVYGDFQKTINYFDASRKLALGLGLYEGYGAEIAKRIDKNITSVDSLMEISADSYYQTKQFLEEQESEYLLGFILVGGWIEGLYLAIESVDGIDMEDPIVERIADQQVLLESLLGYLHNQDKTQSILEVIKDLEKVQEEFDMLYFNDENTIITKKQFVDISNALLLLRNKYIE
jgi:hypothetical protein